jgi:hypothetical protein
MTTGTSFSDIFDSFLLLINDYKLINLYESSQVDFETYLSGWLLYAIQDFDVCDQSLAYSVTAKTFTETLTDKNQLMLARIMVRYWMAKEVADVTQMSLHIQDHDYKFYSEAQNLREKSAHLNQIKEDISQALVEYGLRKNDWASWYVGRYYTP